MLPGSKTLQLWWHSELREKYLTSTKSTLITKVCYDYKECWSLVTAVTNEGSAKLHYSDMIAYTN